jgi:acyl-CoA synthetase
MRPFLTLHHPATARQRYAAGVWSGETCYALLAGHAATRPDAPALRDGRRVLTWREVLAWVEGTAAALRDLGLAGGDRVSIWMSNRAEAVVLFLACSRDGIACNPSLHRTYTAAEVGDLLTNLSARVLLTEPGWGADAPADPVATFGGLAGLRAVWTPDSFPRPATTPGPATPQDPDKVAYLAFTSGTTGAPKCVMHSDNTLLANARDLVRDWGHGPATRILSLSPLSHHIAWVGVAQWLLAGCLYATDDAPPGTSRLDWITETRATYVLGVPTHAMDVQAELTARGRDRLGEVGVFYMAGAAIPPSVADRFVRLGVRPQNVYGMTENSSHQYTSPTDPTEVIVATCGRGGRAYRVEIRDPADPERRLPPDAVGEIVGEGAALMLGYLGNQAATEANFTADGMFRSGDLGALDIHGNLRIEGRLKDLVIRGGHNIYPARIEALALRHPAVERCAAFPVPDQRLGERVCLAVIGDITPPALLAHLAAEGLSRYDMPEWFLRLDRFPLTASGKVLKRELVALAKRGELDMAPVRYQPAEHAP